MCVITANNVSVFQHSHFINTSAKINDPNQVVGKSESVAPHLIRGFKCFFFQTHL